MEYILSLAKMNIQYIILYGILINLIGVGAMALDKYKSQKGYWRISENTLFLITILGGGIGTIFGMYYFRHKTKKLKFTIGFPTILIGEIILLIYIIIKY